MNLEKLFDLKKIEIADKFISPFFQINVYVNITLEKEVTNLLHTNVQSR